MTTKWEKIGIAAGILGLALSGLNYSTDQHNFEREKRPYISITPIKMDNGTYFLLARQGNDLLIQMKFQFKNDGQLPATGIKGPSEAQLIFANGQLQQVETNVATADSNTVTLTAGDNLKIEMTLTINSASEETIKDAFQKYQDGTLTVPVTVPVSYKGDPKSTLSYKSSGYFLVRPTTMEIIETKIE